jgi:GTP-binding protein EngB required for normal cell division
MSTIVLGKTYGAELEEAVTNDSGRHGSSVVLEETPQGRHEAVSFDVDKIKKYLEEIERHTRDFAEKDVVAFCGGTRVGKGTLINVLLGSEYEEGEDGNLSSVGGHIPAVPTSAEVRSHTLYPALYEEKYMDLPGFLDNRGEEERICANLAIELALKRARSVKIVGVIDANSLFGDANNLSELFSSFSHILKFAERKERTPEVLFLFNKRPLKESALKKRIAKLIEEFQKDLDAKQSVMAKVVGFFRGDDRKKAQEIQDLETKLNVLRFMGAAPDRLMVVDPLGNDRQRIQDTLATMQPLPMKELSFSHSEERIKLRAAMYSIADEEATKLQTYTTALLSRNLLNTTISFGRDTINRYQSIVGDGNEDVIARYRQETDDQSLVEEIRAEETRIRNQGTAVSQGLVNHYEKLRKIDSSEKELYWEESVDEQRTRVLWVYSPSWTEKSFSYKGVKFSDVVTSYKDGTFEEKKNSPAEGVYEALYQSYRNYDGIAEVKVYIEKRNKPDIAKEITKLKETIAKSLAEIARLGVRELELSQQLTTVRNSTTRQKLERIKDRLQATVDRFTARKAEHEQSISHYQEQRENINSTFRFLKEYKVVLGDSPIFEAFLKAYEEAEDAESRSEEREMDKDYICSISFEPLLDAVKTPCGHRFNRLYLIRYLSANNSACPCPFCRTRVNVNDLIDDYDVVNRTLDALNL